MSTYGRTVEEALIRYVGFRNSFGEALTFDQALILRRRMVLECLSESEDLAFRPEAEELDRIAAARRISLQGEPTVNEVLSELGRRRARSEPPADLIELANRIGE